MPVSIAHLASITVFEAKAQQEPQVFWFFTGFKAPLPLQSTWTTSGLVLRSALNSQWVIFDKTGSVVEVESIKPNIPSNSFFVRPESEVTPNVAPWFGFSFIASDNFTFSWTKSDQNSFSTLLVIIMSVFSKNS